MNKHQIKVNGESFTRNSKNRTYTHAIVKIVYCPKSQTGFKIVVCGWCGSHALALKQVPMQTWEMGMTFQKRMVADTCEVTMKPTDEQIIQARLKWEADFAKSEADRLSREIQTAKVTEHTLIHIRASGPVTKRSIERYLIEQTPGVDASNADTAAFGVLYHLLSTKQIEVCHPEKYTYAQDQAYDMASPVSKEIQSCSNSIRPFRTAASVIAGL